VALNPVRAKAVKHPRDWAWSSYRATGGQSAILSCLRVDDILSHFGQRRGIAQEKYREYVREGIGVTSIWENLEAQSLLGLEGFAEALREHVTGKETIQEILKGQRFLGRPTLKQLFDESKSSKVRRDRLIGVAIKEHGYSQMEVARHLKLHYSTISRLINSLKEQR
jgi:plasmid maintenance system antidote protein VapI